MSELTTTPPAQQPAPPTQGEPLPAPLPSNRPDRSWYIFLITAVVGAVLLGALLYLPFDRKEQLFQGGMVGLLFALTTLFGERLMRSVEAGGRLGLESRWSRLTGTSSWHLSPTTTWLVLLLSFAGLMFVQGERFVQGLSATSTDATTSAPKDKTDAEASSSKTPTTTEEPQK